jgi:type IV pilus assembly protein PilO
VDFLDKLFEKLPYDKIIPIPTIQRMGAIGGLIAILVAGFYYVVVSSKDQQIDLKNQELSKIQQEVESLRSFERKQGQLEKQLAKLEANLMEAKKVLPSEKEIPTLLQQISDFGVQSLLEMQKFVPKGEVQKTEYYSEVPVDIEVQGKFHNVLSFFDEIAHLQRIVTIGNVTMTAGKEKDPTTLTVKMQAVTYKFIEVAAAKPAGAPEVKK